MSLLRIGEEKLLLPATAQLRSICSSTAWKEVEEPPSLPESGLPRELLLLQHTDFGGGLQQQTGGKEQTVICGLATDGSLGVWNVGEARPLLLLRCGSLASPFLLCVAVRLPHVVSYIFFLLYSLLSHLCKARQNSQSADFVFLLLQAAVQQSCKVSAVLRLLVPTLC